MDGKVAEDKQNQSPMILTIPVNSKVIRMPYPT